ncbi:MAG: UvrB/UvrC motif-containing protein [Gemmatimonadales bacterium]
MSEKQLCTQCGEREGVVTLNRIEGGTVRTDHLCAKCAAEKGIQTADAVADTPLGGLLAALGTDLSPTPASGAGEATACPGCGATLTDFRESGHLGCDLCYTTFAEPLEELLRRLHGSAHHVGTSYSPPDAPDRSIEETTDSLRERLKQAVDREAFELAAELRDRLRERE